nr:mucin-5AC-like isoform X1 [Ipomoea batatas]GMC98329.1 mucin-5AC-like isoform X1 [Ipomoea batatas]
MGSLRNAVMKEKDDELALFFEMYRLEKEQDDLLLLENSDEFDAPLGSATGSSPIYSIASTTPVMKIGTDDFLNSENYKNDYEWLISPPDSPLFSSLELDPEETITSQLETPEACAPVQKCRACELYSPASGATSHPSKRRVPEYESFLQKEGFEQTF